MGFPFQLGGGCEGVVVREAVALAVEIARKSQIVVQVQKEAVNAGTSSSLFFLVWPGFYTALI